MLFRMFQNERFKRSLGQAFAIALTLQLRWSVKRIGWSCLVQDGRCRQCRTSWIAVFDHRGQPVMIEHDEPYVTYPATLCYCGWLSPKQSYEDDRKNHRGHNPALVSQETILCIEKREEEMRRRERPTGRGIRLSGNPSHPI